MKGQIMLDRSGGLHWFHLERCTDVGQRTGTERQRFGMMLLPFGIFCTQVVRSRVLQVRRQHHGLVSSFSGKLDTEIPRIERDKGEFEVFRDQMFVGECVKSGNCITESTGIANVFPREGGKTRYTRQRLTAGFVNVACNSLHNGVIGVLTGLTRILSRCS